MKYHSTILAQTKLPSTIVSELLDYGKIIQIKNKESLIKFGDYVNQSFLVLEGGFVIEVFNNKAGELSTVNFFMQHYSPFMTVSDSYFNNTPSLYQISAFKNSVVIAFDKKVIDEFIHKYPEFSIFFHKTIIDAFIREINLRSNILSMDSKEFFSFIHTNYPILFQ